MTLRIFDCECYIKEFDAEVLSCTKTQYNKTDCFAVELDRTAFFPEEGGQDSDTGTLNGIRVIHASIKDDVITHYVMGELKEGATVHGEIDWELRYDRMQQHSGEHLVSGTIHTLFGYDNVGFHLGDPDVTLDFNGTFTEEDVNRVELLVNQSIWKCIKTHIFFPTHEDLVTIDYRSKKELSGQVRLVEFPGVDMCACCAPHVASTGEIGMVKIISAEHFRGGTRMTIRCGLRALTFFRDRLNDCKDVSRLLSAKLDQVPASVQKLNDSYLKLKYDYTAIEREMLETLAQKALSSGIPFIFTASADADNARSIVNRMASETTGAVGCFIGSDEQGYRFIIGSSGTDCTALLSSLRNTLGAKGGGSKDMIQGTVQAKKEDIISLCTI